MNHGDAERSHRRELLLDAVARVLGFLMAVFALTLPFVLLLKKVEGKGGLGFH